MRALAFSTMIRALVFDFDGLILDTETPEYTAWTEVYSSHKCELPIAVWADCIGRGAGHFDPHTYLEELAGLKLDRTATRAQFQEIYQTVFENSLALPGVESYLQQAREYGLKLAVASSSSHLWVDNHLKKLDLFEKFDVIKCFDDVGQAKPAPDLYLAAVAALGLKPEEAIALEDSPNGIAAAKRAGLYCVAVPNPVTGQLSLSEADLRLNAMTELPLTELIKLAETTTSQHA